MHLILTGATGLVGSGVLDAMLNTQSLTKISILSRRPVPMLEDRKDPRVQVIIHKDYETYDSALLQQLKGAHGCIWALGVSQNDVDAEEYVRITKDYTLKAAKTFSENERPTDGSPFRFVFVSGEGATHNPGRFAPIFSRVKGETEVALAEMAKGQEDRFKVYSVRPCYVDATKHDAIKPYIPDNRGLKLKLLEVAVGPFIQRVYTSQHSPTPFIGRCFTEMAMGKLDGNLEGDGSTKVGGSWVLRNWGLRRIMGL